MRSTTSIPVSWLSVDTPLPSGPLLFALTPEGIAAASYWPEEPMRGLPKPGTTPPPDRARAELVTDRLREYFAGERRELGLPVDWRLTSGPQRVVLETLYRTVSYGATVTYGELAARSGAFTEIEPGSEPPARTVGTIMGGNPLPLLVPCHRVVASDGIGGFGRRRDGVEIKRWLLTLEGVLAPTLEWNGP